jgi:hypothetical protein
LELAAIVTIVFFLAIGAYQFIPRDWLRITVGISAIILGVLALLGATAVTL